MTARRPAAPPRHPTRRRLLGAALAAPLTAPWLTACGGGYADDELPRVRFVNGLADGQAADFLIGGSVIAASLAPYGGRSGYTRTDPGDRRIRVREPGTTTTWLDDEIDLDLETANTVFAYGGGTVARKLRRIEESTSLAPAGAVKVRALHACPGIDGLDVFLTTADANLATTTPTLTASAYDSLGGFATVDTGTYRLVVTRGGSTAIVEDIASITLIDRSIYLLALVPDGASGVNVVVLAEREASVGTGEPK